MRRPEPRFVVGLVLAALLLGWFVARVDPPALSRALLGVSPGWLALSAACLLLEWALRPVRWALLLRPIAPVRLVDLASASVVGAASNTLLPLRGGDLVRPALVARRARIPFATVLSTTVVERIFDVVGVLGVLLATLAALPAEVLATDTVGALRRWGLLLGGAALVALVGALAVARGRSALRRLLGGVPGALGRGGAPGVGRLADGLVATGDPARLVGALAVTAAIWTNGLVAILAILRAFHLDLPLAAGLFVEAAIALSVALPQAPGFLGVFQVVMERTTSLWGAPDGVAQALALVFWVVSFGPVTALGALAAWREGTGLFGGARRVAEAERGVSPGTPASARSPGPPCSPTPPR